MIATRSPTATSAAISPRASARTSSENCSAVTSRQPPAPSLRRSMTARGCSAARRPTTSARFADAGTSARAGMLYSRTTSPSPSTRVYVYLMRVHIVSDVHGAADALATAGDGADMLICLGDMLLFLDYADHTQGIFAELYGAEHAREYIALAGRPSLRRGQAAHRRDRGPADGRARHRPAHADPAGDQPPVRRDVRRAGRAGLPDLRQRGRAADVGRLPQARPHGHRRRPARRSARSRSGSPGPA